jgi:hypothetical protein
MMCLAAYKAQAEAEAREVKLTTTIMSQKGNYEPASYDSMRKIDDAVYAEVSVSQL